MSLAVWQATIVDEDGNVLPFASVEVRLESSGTLVAIKSDRAGATGQANPGTADANGYFRFFAAGGAYRITASLGGASREWRYVAIGTASETDVPLGRTRRHTASGNADFEATDRILVIKKTVGQATTVNVPNASDRNGVAVIIKDGSGDADLFPISLNIADGQDADGILSTDCPGLRIQTPYGVIHLEPYDDGSGYFMLPSQV